MPKDKLNNFAFRTRNGEILLPEKIYSIPINELPEINWNLIDLKEYYKKNGGKMQVPIYSMKGCDWREKTGGCSFCSIPDPRTKIKTSERYWREVEGATLQGATHIRDVADDLPPGNWTQEVFNFRPSSFKSQPTLFRYVSSRQVSRNVAELFSKLNHSEVFTGFESGDDKILKTIGKGSTAKRNINAAKYLADNGIKIIGCWMVGLKGETIESLEKTLGCAEEVARIGNVSAYSATPLIPFPGSRDFEELNKLHPEYSTKDQFDIYELQKEWVKNNCKVNMETILDYRKKILDLAPVKVRMV